MRCKWQPEDPKPQVFKDRGQVERRVTSIIQEFDRFLTAEHPPQVTPTSTFKELQLDSLDEVEVIVHVERNLNVEIPDDVAQQFRGVKDIVDWVMQHPSTLI